MTSGPSPLHYRRLRAPQENRTALVEPPFGEVAALTAANREDRRRLSYDFHGVSWSELAAQAREELLSEAIRYTSTYRDVSSGGAALSGGMPSRSVGMSSDAHGDASDAMPPKAKVFLAGHQPQLFHPGVWLKNFALGSVAREHGAVAVNLVVDSDTMKTHALRVPGGSAAEPQTAPEPLDEPGPVLPYEERRILDPATFSTFGERVAAQIAPLVPEPIIRRWWPLAVARMAETDNLGTCLAQSRHELEGRFGLDTLEIPQSHVCRMRAFAHFTACLLAELPRFLAIHNETLHEYRRLHRIRSTAHPMPDLAVEGPWHEAPYWVWTREDPRRRRLFVRRDGRQLVLSDREAVEIRLPLAGEGDVRAAADRLVELAGGPVRIRSRALITTLFARLLLGDLFIHGIGGAKYDQVTDAVVERFFGVRPPGYLVVSATLHLPVAHQPGKPEDLQAIARRLRELTWHPEKAAVQAARSGRCEDLAGLIAAKRHWIETPQTPENARTRWIEFRRINRELQPWVAQERERLLLDHARISQAIQAEKVLSWREYAFCLFPEATLREFIDELLAD